ncbi:MAG: hypothetical protein AB1626_04490 [Candidatus Micrarchaeota archaeon]
MEKAAAIVYLSELGFEPKVAWAFTKKINALVFPVTPKKTGLLGRGPVEVKVDNKASISLVEAPLAIIGSNAKDGVLSPNTQAFLDQLDLKAKKAIVFVVGNGDSSQALAELAQACTSKGADVLSTISFEVGASEQEMELAVTKLVEGQ